ncbi:MAG: HD-GYP domain-containing protein [Geminicoccaceae bacterium]
MAEPGVLLAHPHPERLRAAAEALAREYPVEVTGDGGAAYEVLACGRCEIALIAMSLPGLSGLEALRRLEGLALGRRPLVIAAGAADDVRLQVVRTHGLADTLLPLPCPDGVLLRAVWALLDRAVERRWAKLPPLPKAMVRTTRGLLSTAVDAVTGGAEIPAERARLAGQQVVEALCARIMGGVLDDLRRHHDYTFAHSFRVASHLATFALATGMRREDAELLAQAGLLHDIGKTAIPVGILDKPGPLDSGEWSVIQRHPQIAAEVLQRSQSLPAHLIRIALRHHERLDGSGYPHGLAGTEIDEPSLLCAIADVHTALTDRRAYRSPVEEEAAFTRMRPLAGRHLEPGLLKRYEAVMLDSRPPDGRGRGG